MFQSNSQQVTEDLDSFDFASTEGNQEIPYITTSSSMVVEKVPSSDENLHAFNKKRNSAEISEDEEYYAGSTSRCYKMSRTACPSDSEGSSVCSNPRVSTTRSSSSSSRRIPTGYAASSSFIEAEAEYGKRMNERPPADTSTDYIKALTSSKGATMCFDIVKAMKKKNKNNNEEEEQDEWSSDSYEMTHEEKKELHRARNRVHARNTRVRKQAYVDELKRTLIQMMNERDESDQQVKNQGVAEERRIRHGVVNEFFHLQTIKESSIGRWNAVLEDSATLDISGRGMFRGVHEMMRQSQETQVFGDGSFSLQQCPQDNFLMEGSKAVMEWTVASANNEQTICGTCRVSFNPLSNKLSSVVINHNNM
jgi:hypothetical protein